jgi:AcrR family transcriptional regulator
MSDSETQPESRGERKKEETRQRIVSIAVDLFRQQGFEATTMEQIAAAVDIAKGTLYHYFPVKEAILSAYIRRSFQEKNPQRIQHLQTLPDTHARMTFMLLELISGVQAQRVIFEKFFTYQLTQILSLNKPEVGRSGIEQLETEIIRMGQKDGEIREDIPLGMLEDLVDFIFIEVAKQFYLSPQAFDAELVIRRCVDLFMNGVKKD